MSLGQRAGFTLVFILLLTGLGTTDAYFTSSRSWTPDTAMSSSSSSSLAGSTDTGPDVLATLTAQGIDTGAPSEDSILAQIVPEGTSTESYTLLKGGDRIGFITWTDSPNVNVFFTSLKEALRTSFSSQMQDLVDEVQDRPGKPTRNVLSFMDPAIAEERLLFIHVRQRLMEFHIAPGHEEEIQGVMDGLTE